MEEYEARNLLLLLMVLFENVHIFNCRSETRSVFRIPLGNNPFLIITVLAAQGIHIAAMYIPGLNGVLEIQPVSPLTWALLLAAALSLVAIMELFKVFRKDPQSRPTRRETLEEEPIGNSPR